MASSFTEAGVYHFLALSILNRIVLSRTATTVIFALLLSKHAYGSRVPWRGRNDKEIKAV
jgi:hypothetical protein